MTVTFWSLPAFAQTTPNSAAGTTTAPAATTPPAGAAAAQSTAEPAKAPKKKKAAKMTKQQEIDKSIDSGTVPARYRSSVPKEYQHYIPFDKK